MASTVDVPSKTPVDSDTEEPDDPVASFRHELDLLLINSKPMITMLTMLADDYKETYAGGIADCIEEHLFAVQSPEVMLPTLYLIDSICKNLGDSSAYVSLFQHKIVRIFTHTFERAKHNKTRLLLHKLRQTWNELFSPEVLRLLDVAVHKLDPGWPVAQVAPKSNRSVLPPSSSKAAVSASTAQPSSLTKLPIPKITRQVSATGAAASKATTASTLGPPSREIIEQQSELQLNDILLRTMNTQSTFSNSTPEGISLSTNNNSGNSNRQQTVVGNRKGGTSNNVGSKRGRNISPLDGGKRRRASSPNSHQPSSNSSISRKARSLQQSPAGNKSSESSSVQRGQQQQQQRRNSNSRDDRNDAGNSKESSSLSSARARALPSNSPKTRKNSSNTTAESLPPPPPPDSVIPLGSSHHVSVSKRVNKPGDLGRRNAEGSAIVAAIRSHRRVSPPPQSQQNRNQLRSQHSKSRSPPSRNSTSERMTFNIPRKRPEPPPLPPLHSQTSLEDNSEERGAFDMMDIDYRTAFGAPPMVKGESDHHLSQPPGVISPPATTVSMVGATVPLAPQLLSSQFTSSPHPSLATPLQPVAPISTPVVNSTSSSNIGQPLLQEPHGSVVLFINAELARLFYLDHVTAVVVKAHPDTPFDTLVSWAPSVLEPRQVFFAGSTTFVYIDEGTPQAQTLCLEFSRVPAPMAFYLPGDPLQQQQTIQLGLPARELVINGTANTIAFGGEAISVFLGESVGYHTFRLSDSRPHLQFSEEVRYDLWTRLVDEARVKAGLPAMAIAFPPAISSAVAPPQPVVKVEAPSQPSQSLESPDLNSLLSKLTAAGLISNPPPSVLAAASATPVEPVKPVIPAAPLIGQTLPPPTTVNSQQLPPLPPMPSTHHPNGRRKTKRERRLERQRYRAAVRHQEQQVLKQQQLAAMQQQAKMAKPTPLKRYLPLEVATLKAVHAFPVDQLYSGTPCTNCSLRFGEEALRSEGGKKSRYARHLDWHFRQNRRLKAKPVGETSSSAASSSRGKGRGGHNSKSTAATSTPTISTAAAAQRRPWYYPLELWILFKEVNDDLEEEAAAAAAFFNANAVASAASGANASTAPSSALLATLASFDWGRFRERVQLYEAFMEVVNGSHAAGANAEAVAATCAKCTVVAESAFSEITCALCKEVLEQKWGEEEEEWRVENAVRYREEETEETEEEKMKTEEGGSTEESDKSAGKIYHPLCLKDYLVAKERAKQELLQQQQLQMEAEEDDEDDEDEEEEDEETDDPEINISSLSTVTEGHSMANIISADNAVGDSNVQVKTEEDRRVETDDRVLIPGLDISLRSSTDNDEAAEQHVKEEEVEKMDLEESTVPTADEAQQKETEEQKDEDEPVIAKEDEEEVHREIEVKVFEFEIPNAPVNSSSSASQQSTMASAAAGLNQLEKEAGETVVAVAAPSEPPEESSNAVEEAASSVVATIDPQSETSLPASSSSAAQESLDENDHNSTGKSAVQLLPKRGGLIINLKKTAASRSTGNVLQLQQQTSSFVIKDSFSSNDSVTSDQQLQKPDKIDGDESVKEEEKALQSTIAHSSSATDQSSDDNKVDGGHHVIKGAVDKDKEEGDDDPANGGSDHHPLQTDSVTLGNNSLDDTVSVLQSIVSLNSNSDQEGTDTGAVGSVSTSLSATSSSPSSTPLTVEDLAPKASPSSVIEVKAEAAAAANEPVVEDKATSDPNYYSRGVEMSSLCSIM